MFPEFYKSQKDKKIVFQIKKHVDRSIYLKKGTYLNRQGMVFKTVDYFAVIDEKQMASAV